MRFSAVLRPSQSFTSPCRGYKVSLLPSERSQFFCLRFNLKQNGVALMTRARIRNPSLQIVKSVLDSGFDAKGDTEPARIFVERLLGQTQKIEGLSEDMYPPLNFEALKSNLLAVLEGLKKKEENLQDAERKASQAQTEVDGVKEELEGIEKEIGAATSKHEELEGEIKLENAGLASKAREIEHLKIHIKNRNLEIDDEEFALSSKKHEIDKMTNELAQRSDEVTKIGLELKEKAQLLNEADEAVKQREIELEVLQRTVIEKGLELEISASLRIREEGNIRVAEANLEKQTKQWLLTLEGFSKLVKEPPTRLGQFKETSEEFERMKKRLVETRTALVASRKSLASSKQEMQQKVELLKQEQEELEEKRKTILSYTTSLKKTQMEAENYRAELRIAEARKQEIEQSLYLENELVEQLREDLNREKSSLKQRVKEEMSTLLREMDQKTAVFEEMYSVLGVKVSELVEAKLEIQHLRYQQDSLRLTLEEKESELVIARRNLEELNQETVAMEMRRSRDEVHLIQAFSVLEKEVKLDQAPNNEWNGTRRDPLEALNVLEQIEGLSEKLLLVTTSEAYKIPVLSEAMDLERIKQRPGEADVDIRLGEKQPEAELKFTRESIKEKEMEVLAAKREVIMKDEEMKAILEELDAREKELESLREQVGADVDDLNELFAKLQKKVGEKSTGDLCIEKLQIEDVTDSLEKLAEKSEEFLDKANLSMKADTDIAFLQSVDNPGLSRVENDESLSKLKAEVARLSDVAEQLAKDAGVADGDNGTDSKCSEDTRK